MVGRRGGPRQITPKHLKPLNEVELRVLARNVGVDPTVTMEMTRSALVTYLSGSTNPLLTKEEVSHLKGLKKGLPIQVETAEGETVEREPTEDEKLEAKNRLFNPYRNSVKSLDIDALKGGDRCRPAVVSYLRELIPFLRRETDTEPEFGEVRVFTAESLQEEAVSNGWVPPPGTVPGLIKKRSEDVQKRAAPPKPKLSRTKVQDAEVEELKKELTPEYVGDVSAKLGGLKPQYQEKPKAAEEPAEELPDEDDPVVKLLGIQIEQNFSIDDRADRIERHVTFLGMQLWNMTHQGSQLDLDSYRKMVKKAFEKGA